MLVNNWRAVVPFKLGPDAKSRLAGLLSAPERAALGLRMARHVLGVLDATGRFVEIVLLSPDRPEWWDGAWAKDSGMGLNPELASWRAGQGDAPVLVIHTDLPLLEVEDVIDLLDCAEASGIALATDRAGEGSNALAIADGRELTFRFGPGSRALHADQSLDMPVILSPGLAADLDTPDDAAFLEARGFRL